MKNYLTYILTCFFILTSLCGFSQKQKLKRADKEYKTLGFIKASEIYERVANKGYRSTELFKKLGNTYYFNAKYEEACKWYEELFKMDSTVLPVYYMRYSQCLKAIGEDEQAKAMYNKFVKAVGENKGSTAMTAVDYLDLIESHSGRYDMAALPVNTDGIDFGGFFRDGKLLFSSTRDTGSVAKRISAWDGLTFLDLYKVSINDDGSIGDVQPLKGDVNTKFHESSACMTKDGKTLYFTRNNTSADTKRKKNEVQYLKIYRATLVDGEWVQVEDLSINGDNYSTAHPVLSPAEDKLYFVSDRPEAIGATDIFYADLRPDGSLGPVQNMGDKINTYGRESFPFVTERNELYFSSDGHFGLGGYDVFYVQLYKKSLGSLINVGRPINSEMDDFAFAVNTATHKGYVSSNRTEGQGYDDIYHFVENKDIRDLIQSRIYGKVTDKDTGEPLTGSTITITDEEGVAVATIKTDVNGDYSVQTDRFVSYKVRAFKEEYSTDEAYSVKGKEEQELNFALERDLFTLAPGDDLAKILGIKEIYFDFDKSEIRPDAEVELEKVLTVMKDYPQLHITIRSHTDSRGNDAYNEVLSERRAQSTMEYLISRGISKERLSAKGYGENELLNKCENSIPCSEEAHQQNRRSEFVVK